MKNKRFLSITMVLLTALFVFAFAAVNKNTAVKADAVDGEYFITTQRSEKNRNEEYNFSTTVPDGFEEVCIDSVTYHIYYDHVTIFSCARGISRDLIVPEKIDGKPVTCIESEAFFSCSFEYVSVPEGVKSIEDRAFEGCHDLRQIQLPESLRKIGDKAFSCCNNLVQIVLPSRLESIGESAFQYCDNLKGINIPASVENIGYYAFDGCEKLDSFVVDWGNEKYSSNEGVLFDAAEKELIKYPEGRDISSYRIPEGVVTINDRAFMECDGIKSVTIPDSVLFIGSHSFANCKNLVRVKMSNNAETLGEEAFYGCDSLKSITIPKGISYIEDGTFADCYDLSDVNMPNELSGIGELAFEGCQSLSTIVLPEDLIIIDDRAFCNTGLKELTLPKGLVSIGNEAFHNCRINELDVPDSVDYIGKGAFGSCWFLKKVALPDGFAMINEDTFSTCFRLSELILPSSIKMISTNAFGACWFLNDVYYNGTAEQWEEVVIREGNDYLINSTMHYGDHVHESITKTVSPTCTSDGNEYEECRICGSPMSGIRVLKATGHTDMNNDGLCDKCSKSLAPTVYPKLSIRTPSVTTVSYGFTLNLHANVTDLPEGARVVWSMDGSGFELIPSADGMTCGVKSVSKGSATITAKVVDKNSNAVKDANGNDITASQQLTSKAGFFQKLAAFFKKLFGSNMVIPYALNKLMK